jgi:hypothetical protein
MIVTMKNGKAYDNQVYAAQCKEVCQICGRDLSKKHKYTCKYWNHPMSQVGR